MTNADILMKITAGPAAFFVWSVVFVDLKSIPYRDTDVVEWFRQLLLVNDFYQPEANRCTQAQRLAQTEGVFLFVIPVPDLPAASPSFRVEYLDAYYATMRIVPETAAR